MSFESEFFKRKQVRFESLLDFGFEKIGDSYHYQEKFMSDNFQAQIEIADTGEVAGQIIDLDLNEPYLAYQIASHLGHFVGQVRAAYAEILTRIAKQCFEEVGFVSDQANRLIKYFKTHYEDVMDHPFKRIPDATVFRHPSHQKWYALIMSVQRAKLATASEKFDKEKLQEEVEIVNIKVNEADLDKWLMHVGCYPSYHMNKTSWMTISLDDSLSDEALFNLVQASRKAVAPKGYYTSEGPAYWLQPANLQHYDIDKEFATYPTVTWQQKGQVRVGDFVAIYITAPIRALRYLCEVVAVDMYEKGLPQMVLKLRRQFSDDQYRIEFLQAHGVKTVRGLRRMTPELVEVMKGILDEN